jgi:hypothetical protein
MRTAAISYAPRKSGAVIFYPANDIAENYATSEGLSDEVYDVVGNIYTVTARKSGKINPF